MRRHLTLLAGALWLAGCGGSGPPTTEVLGTVDGKPFAGSHAVFNRERQIQLLISDDPDMCSHLITVGGGRSVVVDGDGREHPSLFLELGTGHLLGNDTRTIGDDLNGDFDQGLDQVALEHGTVCGHSADAGDGGDGGPCEQPTIIQPVTGTAELQRADDGTGKDDVTAGSLLLHFPDGGALAGTFHAEPCGALHSSCESVSGASLLPLLAALGLRRRRR